MRCGALLALVLAMPVQAAVVTSPSPDAVSVTVYRNPNRHFTTAIDLGALRGFALVTETRHVSIPAGETEIRFEGVADGILTASAVIEGLPQGVVEKNRDARLLTPAGLIDASLGKQVRLVRTHPASGRATEIDARLRSGPEGGVLLETAEGVEALRCSGLPERLIFPEVPAGLTAKPTLSIRTRSVAPTSATLTLAYLAQGFDWTANYVAEIRPDGRTLDLTGWVTLANANSTSFADAQAQVVAGRLNRGDAEDEAPSKPGELVARCWPWDSTSTYPRWSIGRPVAQRYGMPGVISVMAPPPPPAPLMDARVAVEGADEIIVTAVRQEELGDLKLYRVPHATTVTSRAQKQVSLLAREAIPFDRIYRADLYAADEQEAAPTRIKLRLKNDEASHLGLPLPSGQAALFETVASRPMLVAENGIRDSAIGEEVEIDAGESPAVQVAVEEDNDDDDRYVVTLSNAKSEAVVVEVVLAADEDQQIKGARPRIGRRNGLPAWQVTVPANSTYDMSYTVKDTD